MKTSKKHPNAAIFREVGDQPPLPPPVQEGNLNYHAEQNLTALPFEGGQRRAAKAKRRRGMLMGLT